MSKGLQNILFLDIETVGITYNYDELSERLKTQWARKAAFIKRDSDMTDEQLFVQRAGIYAEFGKIVTLGLGYFTTEDDTLTFRTKALYYDNEKDPYQLHKISGDQMDKKLVEEWKKEMVTQLKAINDKWAQDKICGNYLKY